MKRKKIQHFLCLILLIFGIGYPLRAELIGNPSLGYTLDLPEGFRLVNSRENARYVYQNTIIPVGLQVALYPYQQFGTVAAAADHFFSAESAKKSDTVFDAGKSCACRQSSVYAAKPKAGRLAFGAAACRTKRLAGYLNDNAGGKGAGI